MSLVLVYFTSGRDFKLSESYISRNQRRLPRKRALFKGSDAWRQLKGDPSIRGGLFQQERTQSIMDSSNDTGRRYP